MTQLIDSAVPAVTVRPPTATGVRKLAALGSATRPKQWVKNALVLAAPAAALALGDPVQIVRALGAVAAFVAMSSAGYLVNDLLDLESDRVHPQKSRRAIPSGRLDPRTARRASVGLVVASLVLALVVSPLLALVTVGYGLLTFTYSRVLKHIAIVDLVALSACFLMRALAGAAATDVRVSPWFFAGTTAAAFAVAASKRESELRNQGAGATRAVLAKYSVESLGLARSTATHALMVIFCLWAFSGHDGTAEVLLLCASAPLAVGVVRLGQATASGRAEAPESLLLGDRVMLIAGVAATALTIIGLCLAA